MTDNKYKKTETKEKKKKSKGLNFFKTIIDGSFMTNKWTRKQLPFIFFLVFMAALNIGNIIRIEKKQRIKESLQDELNVLKAELSYYSGKAAPNTKPSIIEKRLEELGIKNPNDPHIKIKK